MPELPDLKLYIAKIDERIRGQSIQNIRISKPFLLRSFEPPISAAIGKRVTELRRIGNAYSDEILHAAQLSPINLS